jgi:hypothetical protein
MMPWPLIPRPLPLYPIFLNNFKPMPLVCLSKTPKEASSLIREGIQHRELFTSILVCDTWS